MRRIGLTLVLVLLLTIITPLTALAANPHFVKGPNYAVTSSGALKATGSVAGLGNGDVTVTLSATGYRTCTNRGGNEPPGQTQTVSGSQIISSTKNGRVNFDVTTAALADDCPDRMKSTVTFTSATLTISQGGSVVLQQTVTP